ncbi:MAG: hypothetical protein J6Y72_09735 [Bacteroidales bacterium]|nr:hypothetical protein [Bacteroidales bacterium]
MKNQFLSYLIYGAFAFAPMFVACDKDDDDNSNNINNTKEQKEENNDNNGKTEDNGKQDEDESSLKAVDLGLSVKWANMNIGSIAPQYSGSFFAWGETEKKEEYSPTTYKFYEEDENSQLSLWLHGNHWNYKITKYSDSAYLETQDDVATVTLGSDWHIPTPEDWRELVNNCTRVWCEIEGVYGYKMIGPNGNYIFLPAAGWRSNNGISCAGDAGIYWSSYINVGFYVCVVAFHSKSFDVKSESTNLDINGNYYSFINQRYYGCTVRPVCNK